MPPRRSKPEPAPHLFLTRRAALQWYQDHGGALQETSFYKKVPCNPDKTCGRMWVAEFLISELQVHATKQTGKIADCDYVARKAKADTEKAEYDARIAFTKMEAAEREHESRWVLRDDAEDHEAALVGVIKETFRHRVYLDHQDLLISCGGDHGRAAEFAHNLQSLVDRAFNDVADYKELDVEFSIETEDGK